MCVKGFIQLSLAGNYFHNVESQQFKLNWIKSRIHLLSYMYKKGSIEISISQLKSLKFDNFTEKIALLVFMQLKFFISPTRHR